MFLLLPLLLVGGLLYAATRNHPRATSPQLALPAPAAASSVSGDNSPLAVLAEFCRAGQAPPPILIQCAIAQAEGLGRFDLRDHIVRTWILPIVEANQPAPQQRVPAEPPAQPPSPQAQPPQPQPQPQRGPIVRDDGQAIMVTDEQAAIDAALAQMAQAAGVQPVQQTQANAPTISAGEIDMAMHAAPRDSRSRGPAPSRSPIGGVDRSAWSEFVDQVMREEPTFSSARHVGQFRHRRDRLTELGINADRVIGDPRAQTSALEADMADAYRHASASGMVDQFIGYVIDLPDGRSTEVTLSGMLGVIQTAGLDGALGWLEDPADRIRFPHTTMAFVRTNGVF